jgi:serine/threonine-protein kinase RsbW
MNSNHIVDGRNYLRGGATEDWHNLSDYALNGLAAEAHFHDSDNQSAHGGAADCALGSESVLVCIRSAAALQGAIGPILAAMLDLGYAHRDMFAMRLALEEAIVNAVKHGNASDPDKEVRIRFHVTADEALAEVEDEGPGFDPHSVRDPLAAENLERPCGRGLLLMEYYMTRVQYSERGNSVTLGRRRSCE